MSLATLSYWRAGLRQPEHEQSMRALVAIEEILRLFPGELESLVPPRRRRPRADPLDHYPGEREVVRRLLAELGMTTPFDEVVDREITIKYDVDERGRSVRLTHISVVEAVIDGAARHAVVTLGEDPAEPPLRFTALGGYRQGRVVADPGSRVTVVEMLLERELAAGETAILEQQMDLDGSEDDNELVYWAQLRVKTASLWVRFHPAKVPSRCEAFSVVEGIERAEEIQMYGSSVTRTVSGFGPGTFGIRWFWE